MLQVLEKEATIKQIIKQQRQVKREGHKLAVQRLYAEGAQLVLPSRC